MASFNIIVKSVLFIFLLSVHFSRSYGQLQNTTETEVKIRQGTLLGGTVRTSNNRNISAFLGIPYAQPPIDNLRFSDPVPADDWTGTRNARIDASVCPQISNGVIIGDEDCLYLNVYTPQLPKTNDSTLLPVMVYVHGGGFKAGSGTYSEYSPEYILNEDIVLVILNYRLGSLGLLSTGDNVASGNWALKDVVLALRWVQTNIQYFSGDANQVTLFGESAGGGLVDLLTLSDATIGLFHKCITQSGSAMARQTHEIRATVVSRAFELGEYFGCPTNTSDSLISCLRTFDFAEITTLAASLQWSITDEPDIEGAILTDSPTNLFAAGKSRNMPQISGVTRDEGLMSTTAYYEDEESFLDVLKNFDSTLLSMLGLTDQSAYYGATWVAAIKSYYFNDDLTANTSLLLSNLTLLVSDIGFHYPAYKALQQRLSLGVGPQYFYVFNYLGALSSSLIHFTSPENYGVMHADDLIYLFPWDSTFSNFNQTRTETDFQVVDTMVQLWTSFASNGIPTASALDGDTWEPYSTAETYYLRIGNKSDPTPEFEYSTFEDRMQFWARLEGSEDSTAPVSDSSSAATSLSVLIIALLLACSKLVLPAAIADWLG